MKALRKTESGSGHLALEDVPRPEIEADEILMKVRCTGVCGSDILIQDDRHFYEAPVTLGHEFAGVACEVGRDVSRVREGDLIVGDIETRSGWLGVTRDGGFAPYMVVPESQAYTYPENVSLEDAVFTEPVVAILHALQERNTVNAGDTVVVVGPGSMGLLGVQFARLRGAGQVILIGLRRDERRLSIGRKTGADHVLYSEDGPLEAVLDLTSGKGADVVLECSASEDGVQHALDAAKRSPEGRGGRGRVTFISLWGRSIRVNLDAVSLHQLSVQGAWSWNGPETWERAVSLIINGAFDFQALEPSRYELHEWERAFENVRNGNDVKALIFPSGQDW